MYQDTLKRERKPLENNDQNDEKTDLIKPSKVTSFFRQLKNAHVKSSTDAIESVRNRLNDIEVEQEIETEKIFAANQRLADLNEEMKDLTKVLFSYLENGISDSEQPQQQEKWFSDKNGLISEQFLLYLKKELEAEGITLQTKTL